VVLYPVQHWTAGGLHTQIPGLPLHFHTCYSQTKQKGVLWQRLGCFETCFKHRSV
jgi:hypothetical protein